MRKACNYKLIYSPMVSHSPTAKENIKIWNLKIENRKNPGRIEHFWKNSRYKRHRASRDTRTISIAITQMSNRDHPRLRRPEIVQLLNDFNIATVTENDISNPKSGVVFHLYSHILNYLLPE